MAGLLSRRTLLLAKIEATPLIDALPSHLTDALLVEDPQFSTDLQVLERNFARDDLSPMAHVIGRKLASMTFTTELKGNGKVQSGDLNDAPMVAKLMQACGYQLNPLATIDRIGRVFADAANPVGPEIEWVAGGAPSNEQALVYTVRVATAGASGVAKVTVTSSNQTLDPTNLTQITLTSGEPLALGAKGGTITPTWTGALVLGQTYRVVVSSEGIEAVPISADQKTVTLYMYRDGVLHKMTGSLGSFTVTAPAGEYAKVEFTFTGQYIAPVDEAIPSGAVFEETLPPIIELANLTYNSNKDLFVNQFTFEQANEINPRMNVNGSDGYSGTRITARNPTGGFDPEAELVADAPFWQDMADGRTKHFFARVGKNPGNMVAIEAPGVQTSALAYGDRDGLLTYDVSWKFARVTGNDEVRFVFN